MLQKPIAPAFQETQTEPVIPALTGAAWKHAVENCFATWQNASPDELAAMRAYIAGLHTDFLAVIADVSDAAERHVLTALFYTQIKAQWVLLNTQSGYKINAGTFDDALFCRCGLLSAILAALETTLSPGDVAHVNDFIAEPLVRTRIMDADAAQLSERIGFRAVPEGSTPDTKNGSRVLVDAHQLESRFAEMSLQISAYERERESRSSIPTLISEGGEDNSYD